MGLTCLVSQRCLLPGTFMLMHIASAFGGLMYEMLISRPDITAVVAGAFTLSAISLSVNDAGIMHGEAMQVLCRYLEEVCPRSLAVLVTLRQSY